MSALLRLFWLGPNNTLYPPMRNVNDRVPRRVTAVCTKNRAHRPPAEDCTCGWYGCDNAESLRPLAVWLRRANSAAAAAGVTPVVAAVELENAVRADHPAHTDAFAALLITRMSLFGEGPVVEGPGTWRGSTLTITGPIHIPTVPGTTGVNAQATRSRYRCPTITHDGDIVDVVEALTRDEVNTAEHPDITAAEVT